MPKSNLSQNLISVLLPVRFALCLILGEIVSNFALGLAQRFLHQD